MDTTLDQDFTFPTTTTTGGSSSSPPRFLDSPPLWRPSATPRCEKPKGKEAEDILETTFNFPSFQELRASSAKERNCSSRDEYEQEKMDMLWEDLNDDKFSRNRGGSGKLVGEDSEVSSPRRQVQINCVKTLKLSKTNGHIVSGKKTNILVFIKVLKKVFLMHNSQRAIKKPSW